MSRRIRTGRDQGDLICPWCEATWLVTLDEETLERVDQTQEFARSVGLGAQFEEALARLDRCAMYEVPRQCMLGKDFAPHSFGFC